MRDDIRQQWSTAISVGDVRVNARTHYDEAVSDIDAASKPQSQIL